ncbi:MAG: 1-deoxy-D-xylulose-5-phosphate reductoisomerase, partial [Acidobacteriota bacterium]
FRGPELVELVVSAIVGVAGLVPTHAAVAAGRTLALANKEVMVVAGRAILRAAHLSGAKLLPVDSEHCALHQCLRAGALKEVSRLILTASGGPCWERDPSGLESVTVTEALNHPVWDMGPKITVDSATLMNKGLEVIEARWLFEMDPSRIEILIHREGIVHSLVEFVDGSIMAQMGKPDMRHPIQYALTWPERQERPAASLDLADQPALTFQRPDHERFPCPGLAYRALALGGTATAALNGANEVLVQAFLEESMRFSGISLGLRKVLDHVARGEAPGAKESEPDLATCQESDAWARRFISEQFLTGAIQEAEGQGG